MLIFLCPVVFCLGSWEHLLNNITTSYSKKRQHLEANLPSIEVLILGNSMTHQGINPAYLSRNTYNLADASQSLYYDKELTEKYLDKMVSLKLVVINLSYYSLWYEDDRLEAWRRYFYYQYWGIKNPSISAWDINCYSKIMLFNNLIPWSYALKGFKVDMATNITAKGWNIAPDGYDRIYGHDKRNDSIGKTRANGIEAMCDETNFKTNCQYLVDFVTELQKRNVKVVFITTPATQFMNKYADQKKIIRTDSLMDAFSKTYHTRYFNYFLDRRFNDSDFHHVDHLNVYGAKKFTNIIDKEILMDSTLSKN